MLPDRPHPAPFDTSTFIFPAEWHAFSDLLGGADTGLLFLRDGHILHLNTHLLDQLGYDDDKLIGQPVEMLFAPGSSGAPSGHGPGSVIRLQDRDGQVHAFELLSNRIDSLGDARCTIWVMRPLPESEAGAPASRRERMHAVAADAKRQLHYFNRLFRIAQRPQPDVESTVKAVLKAAARALGVHRCACWEISDDPATVRCMTAYDDLSQNYIGEVPAPPLAGILHALMRQVLRDERVFAADDVDVDPRSALHCEYFHANAVKAVMIAPVSHGGKMDRLLVFAQFHESRRWSKDDAEFAANIALLVSRIFREADFGKMKSHLRSRTYSGSRTGLPGREFLAGHAAGLFPAPRAAGTVAAFLIDIDHFRTINENYSHDVGDDLLKAATLRLKNIVRKDDVLAHIGADRFALIARDLNGSRVADDIAQQIVDTLRGTFSLQGMEFQVSASVGIALHPAGGTDVDTLLANAEIALRRAKAAGGCRYLSFVPEQNGRSAQSGAQG